MTKLVKITIYFLLQMCNVEKVEINKIKFNTLCRFVFLLWTKELRN